MCVGEGIWGQVSGVFGCVGVEEQPQLLPRGQSVPCRGGIPQGGGSEQKDKIFAWLTSRLFGVVNYVKLLSLLVEEQQVPMVGVHRDGDALLQWI